MSEYSICRSAMGWTACGAADGLRPHFREADVAHVAGLDHVGDGADGVFDGHVGIEARGAVDVDVVGAQALERVGQERF